MGQVPRLPRASSVYRRSAGGPSRCSPSAGRCEPLLDTDRRVLYHDSRASCIPRRFREASLRSCHGVRTLPAKVDGRRTSVSGRRVRPRGTDRTSRSPSSGASCIRRRSRGRSPGSRRAARSVHLARIVCTRNPRYTQTPLGSRCRVFQDARWVGRVVLGWVERTRRRKRASVRGRTTGWVTFPCGVGLGLVAWVISV